MKQAENRNWQRAVRNVAVAVFLFGLAPSGFAVDGTMSGGKSAKSRSSAANIRKDLQLRLDNGFQFNGNKSLLGRGSSKSMGFHSIMTYQKGNVTYFLPYKNKVILQKFKTPAPPSIR